MLSADEINDLPITAIADEAANQPHEGKVAVGIVGLNRMKAGYQSDGTPEGTWLHKWAFSGFWAAMDNGQYKQISFDLEDAENEFRYLRDEFKKNTALWANCTRAWEDANLWTQVKPLSFRPGPQFARLSRHTVLYYNPQLVANPPSWAVPANLDAVIFQHTFYHDGGNQ